MGNLAGQLLDESIHQLPNTHSYAQSVKDFFKNNAIGLLTAGVGPQFHSDAQKQKQNIAKAIHSTLPQDVKGFNSKEGMVEPDNVKVITGINPEIDAKVVDFINCTYPL